MRRPAALSAHHYAPPSTRLSSASRSGCAAAELERLGAAFLGKPFTPHELNAKIVELLDRPRPA